MRASPLLQRTLLGLGMLLGCASDPVNTLAPVSMKRSSKRVTEKMGSTHAVR